jgi:hypothetical protein
MSLAESFLKTAKDMLMMSENIKRLDTRIDRISDDMSGLDRRLMRIEVMIDLSKTVPRKRPHPELP